VPLSSGVDLSVYSLGQLVYLLSVKKPLFAAALGSAVNKLKVKTDFPPGVTFPELLEAYKGKYKETQVIHPIQITDWAATNGVAIEYVKSETVAPLADMLLVKVPKVAVKPQMSELIVVEGVNLPLYQGVPLVDVNTKVHLEKVIGKPVFVTTKLEVLVVKNVVDLVKVQDGIFVAKTFSANSLVTSPELKDSAFVVADYLAETFGAVTDKLGKNCHYRGKALVQELFLLISRIDNRDGKLLFLKHIYDVVRGSKIFLNIKKTIGDHDIGSVGHAHAFYESSRSIRGADRTDSTSTGLSTYIPFDMNRQIMEYMIIAKNFHNLSQVIDMSRFNLIGKDAVKVVTALMFVASSKITQIGLTAAISGWKYSESGFGHHVNVQFTLTSLIPNVVTVYLDEQTTPNNDRSQVSSSFFLTSAVKGVQSIHAGWATRDTNFKQFIPSVAIHSLKGFYLNIPLGNALVIAEDYYKASVYVNRSRVLPSFCNQRAYDILYEYKLVNMLLKSTFITVALKKASSIIAEDGVMSSYEDFHELLAQYTKISEEEFESSCKNAERETADEAEANDAAEDEEEVKEEEKEEKKEARESKDPVITELDEEDFT